MGGRVKQKRKGLWIIDSDGSEYEIICRGGLMMKKT